MPEGKIEKLVDERLIGKDYSGNQVVAAKALDHVIKTYKRLVRMRNYSRGGQSVNIVNEWDKRYRAYRCIFNTGDHSYKGESKVFNPALRKAVNIIESEMSNALFSREDYFSVNPQGNDGKNDEMARIAFGTIKYYSDLEKYTNQYDLAVKQCLIYGSTVMENEISRNYYEGIFRKIDTEAVRDPESGEPLIGEDGRVVTTKKYNIYKYSEQLHSAKLEVRDIYRLYIDHRLNKPEDGDLVYRDSISAQDLLMMAKHGVYSQKAVENTLKGPSQFGNKSTTDLDGADSAGGKSFIGDIFDKREDSGEGPAYEVLRYQGLFTVTDEKSGQKIRKQFWIDVAERKHVLRVIENPLVGEYKTFTLCNYDNMPFEHYSDSVLSPFLSLLHGLNDKENQSVDALTFNLNAPIEVLTSSDIKQSDLTAARHKPNMMLKVRELNSVQKMQVSTPLEHLNLEISRMESQISSGTGATTIASGAPTGTQADRSGKAIGTLLAQSRSQFSKFVRKFENNLIKPTLQKTLDLIVQFFDAPIDIQVMGEKGAVLMSQSPAEICGRFNVMVSSGSEYLKERENRDSLLEFMSIASMNDTFMAMLDKEKVLMDIARSMPGNYEKYIDADNAINQMQQQIQQLTQVIKQQQDINESAMAEVERLVGVVKQTNKAAQASPSMYDQQKNQQKVQAQQNQGGR